MPASGNGNCGTQTRVPRENIPGRDMLNLPGSPVGLRLHHPAMRDMAERARLIHTYLSGLPENIIIKLTTKNGVKTNNAPIHVINIFKYSATIKEFRKNLKK